MKTYEEIKKLKAKAEVLMADIICDRTSGITYEDFKSRIEKYGNCLYELGFERGYSKAEEDAVVEL